MIIQVTATIDVAEDWVDAFYAPPASDDVPGWVREFSLSAIETWLGTYSPLPGAPRLVSLHAEEAS
jgi:hypothetical protein